MLIQSRKELIMENNDLFKELEEKVINIKINIMIKNIFSLLNFKNSI